MWLTPDPADRHRCLTAAKFPFKFRQFSVLFIKDLALARVPGLFSRPMPALDRALLIEIYCVSDRLRLCLSSILRGRSLRPEARAGQNQYFLTLILIFN